MLQLNLLTVNLREEPEPPLLRGDGAGRGAGGAQLSGARVGPGGPGVGLGVGPGEGSGVGPGECPGVGPGRG